MSSGQLQGLVDNLTPDQIAKLDNLNPCQLQVFLNLTTAQQQAVTNNPVTATQLSDIVSVLNPQQLTALVTGTTTNQLLVGASLTPSLYQDLFRSLTVPQILQLVTGLTGPQLTNLANLTSDQISTLVQTSYPKVVSSLTPAQLAKLVDSYTTAQLTAVTDLEPPNIIKLSDVVPQVAANIVSNLVPGNITPALVQTALASLTPGQLNNLANLTPNQMQTALTASVSALLTLTQTLTPPQVASVVDSATAAQLTNLAQSLTSAQLVSLSGLAPNQVQKLVQSFSVAQLANLLNSLTASQLASLANALIGDQTQFPVLPNILGTPSSTPVTAQGYVPVVVDSTNNLLYGYTGGSWNPIGGDSTSSGPTWVKVSVSYTDYAVASMSSYKDVYTAPAGAVILATKLKHSVQWAGTGIASVNLNVGNSSGGASVYMGDQYVAGAPSSGTGTVTLGKDSTNFTIDDHSSTFSIRVYATSTGANLDQLTAGAADVWILLSAVV